MKILIVASYYPHPSIPFAGVFIERCVTALRQLGTQIEVLAVRPYAPRFVSSLMPRWQAYSRIEEHEIRDGILICRPPYFVVPKIGQAFWSDRGAFLCCRHVAKRMHRVSHFDCILSFDLAGAGGIAWRLGAELGIPTVGWGFGDDVRVGKTSSLGRVVTRALMSLDVIFYQSAELRAKSAALLGTTAEQLNPKRHIVLSHGIPEPPQLETLKIRDRIRTELRLKADDVLLLNIGRVCHEKGISELIESAATASMSNPSIKVLIVGTAPGFDDSFRIKKRFDWLPNFGDKIWLLPACHPDQVWEYLCAADIFAFCSHREGMPNSLLEAMVMGVPAISFGIPPVREVEAGLGSPLIVPCFETKAYSDAILALAASPNERTRIGEIGRKTVRERYMVKENMTTAFRRISEMIYSKTQRF